MLWQLVWTFIVIAWGAKQRLPLRRCHSFIHSVPNRCVFLSIATITSTTRTSTLPPHLIHFHFLLSSFIFTIICYQGHRYLKNNTYVNEVEERGGERQEKRHTSKDTVWHDHQFNRWHEGAHEHRHCRQQGATDAHRATTEPVHQTRRHWSYHRHTTEKNNARWLFFSCHS